MVGNMDLRLKYHLLPLSEEVQESLYKQTIRLLNFVDGREEERMVAIDFRTGEVLADNFEKIGSYGGTGFTHQQSKIIKKNRGSVILLLNHPLNDRPSVQEMITYAKNEKIKLTVIACHDGTVYAIYTVKEDIRRYKEYATDELYKLNDSLSGKDKIFDIRKF